MTAIPFPQVPFAHALGVGLDMRFGDAHGFVRKAPADDGACDVIAPRLRRFLHNQTSAFAYAFFSFQPKDRGLLDPEDYFPIWDQLVRDVPGYQALALHHTQLNLATIDTKVDRSRLLAFTNAMIERYDLRWVNEDVGIWSIAGKVLPYPLPPILSLEGLNSAVAHVAAVQRGLSVPLVLEFPGFTHFDASAMHAYDFFCQLAQRTNAPVTLDIAHLLSYRWLAGHRGPALYEELSRLPLEHCFEIHLSGCYIQGDRFVDAHHGVLIAQQLELLQALLSRCPNLRAVTYEDPKVAEDGSLPGKARAPFARLQKIVASWVKKKEQDHGKSHAQLDAAVPVSAHADLRLRG